MDLIRTLLQDVHPGDTILDIGANEGGYTYLFRQHCPDATIHAFEPIPSVYSHLKARYADDLNVHCWHLGVGATVETVHGVAVHEAWTINRPGETRRGRNATHGDVVFDMKVTTVDAFLSEWPGGRAVRAIKIDTDGYDFRALKGAAATIQRCRPRILIEFGYCIADLEGIDVVWNMLGWISTANFDVYNQHGEKCEYRDYEQWYPHRTTADFLLVPAEKPLNPIP